MIIGIDIGTSYSSVAILKDGKAKDIKVGTESSASVPSAVYVKEDGTILIGRAAVATRMIDPSRFKDNFKRDFGTIKPYLLGDREITPDEIYTEYFRYFQKSAEDFTGQNVTKAYITHPVSYSASKRMLLKQAANYAGLLNVELLDEPTAAALSFFAEHTPHVGEILLIYDLGGGTLDLTLAEVTADGLRLLTGPVGDEHLGGADFDRLLYDDIVREFSRENDLTKALTNNKFCAILNDAAVGAKLNLSGDTSAMVSIPYGFGDMLQYTVTRGYFNELIEKKIRYSCALIEKIAGSAGLTPAQIDRVLCVGGSTRIPLVTMLVEETIGKSVKKTADPELAVCLGAVLKESVKVGPAPEKDEKEQEFGSEYTDDLARDVLLARLVSALKSPLWRMTYVLEDLRKTQTVQATQKPEEDIFENAVHKRLSEAFRTDKVLPVLFAGRAQVDLQSDKDGFALIVDDVYTIVGKGTVVTGVVEHGAVKLDDTLKLCDVNAKERRDVVISGIEMSGVLIDSARTGDIIGLLLKDVKHGEVEKGYHLLRLRKKAAAAAKKAYIITIERKDQFFIVNPKCEVYLNRKLIAHLASGESVQVGVMKPNMAVVEIVSGKILGQQMKLTAEFFLLEEKPHILFWSDRITGKFGMKITGAKLLKQSQNKL